MTYVELPDTWAMVVFDDLRGKISQVLMAWVKPNRSDIGNQWQKPFSTGSTLGQAMQLLEATAIALRAITTVIAGPDH